MADFSTEHGQIITFYSYKGGTGRSMALANVACIIAEALGGAGKRTLMMDWDLDAPGLHKFFPSASLPADAERQSGIIDYFVSLKRLLDENDGFYERVALSTDVLDRHIPIGEFIISDVVPGLDLMPAGKLDEEYARRVGTFDWLAFYDRYPTAIASFRNQIAAQYAYCLIDSRTGFNDISGICTSLLPEKLVTVFTPNRQSLEGIVDIIGQSTRYRRSSNDFRPLSIFPMPSRIENAEKELRQHWRSEYQRQFEGVFTEIYDLQECDLNAYFDEVQVPHVSYYAYGENIAVLSERSDSLSLSRAYRSFTNLLVSSDFAWKAQAFVQGRATRLFLAYASDDTEAVASLYRRLKDDGYHVWLDQDCLLPGQNWKEELSTAVRDSDFLVICLSHLSVARKGSIPLEIELAIKATEQAKRNITIVPVKLDVCDTPPYLAKLQAANLYEPEGYHRLVQALPRLLDLEPVQTATRVVIEKPIERRIPTPTSSRKYVLVNRDLLRLRLSWSLPVSIVFLIAAIAVVWKWPPPLPHFGQQPKPEIVLRVCGSNTIGSQLMPALAEAYLKQQAAKHITISPGSSEEVQVSGTLPGQRNSDAFAIAAHGTATAFTGLAARECDIGMSSRPISPDEKARLLELGDMSSSASEHVLGLSGVVVIVNRANPIRALSIDQVRRIFTCSARDWSEVGGTRGTIQIYAPDYASSTYGIFKSLALEDRPLCSDRVFTDFRLLSDQVAHEAAAIGFVMPPDVGTAKAVAISEPGAKSVLPSPLSLATEDYPLTHRLYLYTPSEPDNIWTQRFIQFALSKEGQEVVKFTGFVSQDVSPLAAVDEFAYDLPAYRILTAGADRLALDFRFAAGTATLDSKAVEDLHRITLFLADPHFADRKVLLIGFADSRGRAPHNQALALERAALVGDLLKKRNIKVAIASLGSQMPVASNLTAEGRAKNRRVEVWLK